MTANDRSASAKLPRVPAPHAPTEVDADILGALEHAIAIVTAGGQIIDANHAWERILGRAIGDCPDRQLWSCYPIFSHSASQDVIRATIADGATRRFEVSPPVAGRRTTYGARVARTAQGLLVIELALPYAAGDARDASDSAALAERSDENAALRVLAKQMSEVVDSARLLEILCDAASEQCSGAGAAVIQTSAVNGEIVAATGRMAIARGRRFPLDGSLAGECIESRSTVTIDDFSASNRPLARTVTELDVGPMLLAPLVAHDNVLGTIAVVRESQFPAFSAREAQRLHIIADHAALALWKAELLEQAQAADHAKGRFLATISHELRTPLTALTGYEELLADQVLGPLEDAQRDVLERMRSVTHHLTVMIEEVLAFSSLEAGRGTVRTTEFLAADLLRAVSAIIESLVRQKGLRLRVELPDEPIRLTSDVDKIRQILVNLAGNAVKFTDEGEVVLAVRRGPRDVRFSISDTGIGIAAADLRRLFRPFSQVDTGLTRRHGGTGLGLYISQRLARLLGGRIDVDTTVGEGSTFTLVLPSD